MKAMQTTFVQSDYNHHQLPIAQRWEKYKKKKTFFHGVVFPYKHNQISSKQQ